MVSVHLDISFKHFPNIFLILVYPLTLYRTIRLLTSCFLHFHALSFRVALLNKEMHANRLLRHSSLLLKRRWKSADSLPLQVDINFNSVRYLDERDAAIHAVVLTVKGHGPNNGARGAPLA